MNEKLNGQNFASTTEPINDQKYRRLLVHDLDHNVDSNYDYQSDRDVNHNEPPKQNANATNKFTSHDYPKETFDKTHYTSVFPKSDPYTTNSFRHINKVNRAQKFNSNSTIFYNSRLPKYYNNKHDASGLLRIRQTMDQVTSKDSGKSSGYSGSYLTTDWSVSSAESHPQETSESFKKKTFPYKPRLNARWQPTFR